MGSRRQVPKDVELRVSDIDVYNPHTVVFPDRLFLSPHSSVDRVGRHISAAHFEIRRVLPLPGPKDWAPVRYRRGVEGLAQ